MLEILVGFNRGFAVTLERLGASQPRVEVGRMAWEVRDDAMCFGRGGLEVPRSQLELSEVLVLQDPRPDGDGFADRRQGALDVAHPHVDLGEIEVVAREERPPRDELGELRRRLVEVLHHGVVHAEDQETSVVGETVEVVRCVLEPLLRIAVPAEVVERDAQARNRPRRTRSPP